MFFWEKILLHFYDSRCAFCFTEALSIMVKHAKELTMLLSLANVLSTLQYCGLGCVLFTMTINVVLEHKHSPSPLPSSLSSSCNKNIVGKWALFDSYEKCLCNDQCYDWWTDNWLADCMWQKLKRCDFLGHYKYDRCQTLHDGSTQSCTHSCHFQWACLYFKVVVMLNSFSSKFYVHVWLSWNFIL